jgi:N utilization substance protein B
MLSRRNIRIKIMQLQYANRLDETLSYPGMKNRYARNVDESYNLYLFCIWQLVKIAEYTKNDAAKRASKYLPSEEDKRFSPKLYENDLIRSIEESEAFQKMVKSRKISARVNNDMTRLFYTEFLKTDSFKDYLTNESPIEGDHREVLLSLYKFCLANETYNDYIEDKFDNWIHDKSLIVGAMKKTIKSLPSEDDFFKPFVPADKATLEFGEDLLYKSDYFDSELMELVEPALKNWDIARVAIIDLVLIKLALCEMLYFPTIPVKVTINEFVDISKIYSTPKSKDFINGILDRLMKKLTEEGRIQKEGRGLVD